MPDTVTSACQIYVVSPPPEKIGTGNELPDACFMWQSIGQIYFIATLPSSTPCHADEHIDRTQTQVTLQSLGVCANAPVRSLSLSRCHTPKACDSLFANLLVDDLQSVKGGGDIASCV